MLLVYTIFSKEEMKNLMKIYKNILENTDKMVDAGVRIRVIGNLSFIRKDIRESIARAMMRTEENNKIIFNFALSYTHLIFNCLYVSNVDLLIRTSGEVRLSDFLM